MHSASMITANIRTKVCGRYVPLFLHTFGLLVWKHTPVNGPQSAVVASAGNRSNFPLKIAVLLFSVIH